MFLLIMSLIEKGSIAHPSFATKLQICTIFGSIYLFIHRSSVFSIPSTMFQKVCQMKLCREICESYKGSNEVYSMMFYSSSFFFFFWGGGGRRKSDIIFQVGSSGSEVIGYRGEGVSKKFPKNRISFMDDPQGQSRISRIH